MKLNKVNVVLKSVIRISASVNARLPKTLRKVGIPLLQFCESK